MQIKKVVIFLQFYGFDVLLLGLLEKLLKGLVKKLEIFLPNLQNSLERLITNRTARKDSLKRRLEELSAPYKS